MKKNEVQIGACYKAKVSDKIATVRIDRVSLHGGWDATNLNTGKSIRIKSAQRLRVRVWDSRDNPPADETQPAPGETTGSIGETNQAPAETSPEPAGEAPRTVRLSALDAAALILQQAGTAMHCPQILTAMSEQGLWISTRGKTPVATLHAAISREIKIKGDAARFRKVERGQFEFAGRA